ncbi:FAD-binding protein [Nibrella saemangeumensis]|uniref:FAD-binding protein n=1 Tax=Nibrella saemangeumensis TaxID=1084526 RepID=A0ABP8N3J6_9BACT
MKKRTFIKLSSAVIASPVLSPLLTWAGETKLKNWAGNYTYSTDCLHRPSSAAQVQALVKKLDSLRVLGTRHCFNGIADSTQNLVSPIPMEAAIAIDAPARTVTVDAGLKYGQLAPYLHKNGFALHNLASLPHISIAGACATATHGSGMKNGNLATAVSALEMITAGGDVVRLSRKKDGDTFRGAVVGLGTLGVVTKVTLDLQPTYMMKQYVYENLPLSQLKEHFNAIMASGYSVSLFTDWQKQRINEVWIKSRLEASSAFQPNADFYGAMHATKNLHPIAELSAENCTEQMGVTGPWYERLPHFRMGFTPSSGKELQSEYFVPRQHAVEAILAVERLRNQVSPHLMISEVRSIAADELWMSPCYKQPSIALHFTWKQDWPSVSKVLPLIEKELAAYQARPHWGKLFTMAPAKLQSLYEKLHDFKQLAKQYDPKGKLRNEFIARNLYGN